MLAESMRRLLRRAFSAIVLLALVPALAVAPRVTGPSATLTHASYVQDVTPTSFAVLWDTDQPSTGRVELERAGSAPLVEPAPLGLHHEVVVSSLIPGTRYRYRVVVEDGAASEWSSAVTAPEGSAPFTFAVIGDAGVGSEAQWAIAEVLDQLDPDLVLITGDVVYPSGALADYLPKFFLPYERLIRRRPIYPALGNHDYLTDRARPYLDVFRLSAGSSGTERYYSFDYGAAHFSVLDSNQALDPASPQYRWLAADLASTAQFWKFVFLHHPPFSSSKHGSSLELREALAPLFERLGVDVVFAGHDHNYERTIPIQLAGPGGRAVTYVVTGGGGAPLYPAGRSDFTAVSRSISHTVRLLVDGPRFILEAVDSTGAVFDRWILNRGTDLAPSVRRTGQPLIAR
ncbi:MAG: metallophosphoesterase [Chloroflexi bacterium]|nr:metallophosphoesterase [Chloroflexota bacterium]